MVARKPLVRAAGKATQLPAGDTLDTSVFGSVAKPLLDAQSASGQLDALGMSAAGKIVVTGAPQERRDALGVRELLTSSRTYYVRADGTDANSGLINTAAGAFLTLQKAVDVVAALDISIYQVSIQVGTGTFAGVTLKDPVGSGVVLINGTGSASTIIQSTAASGSVVDAGSTTRFILANCAIEAPLGTVHGVRVVYGGMLALGDGMQFRACTGYHVNCNGGTVTSAAYSVSGGALVHWYAAAGGRLIFAGIAVTITGTPVFQNGWAFCETASLIRANANTFTGAATGRRYYASGNSLISVNGAGESYFPGSAVGATASGGQYV